MLALLPRTSSAAPDNLGTEFIIGFSRNLAGSGENVVLFLTGSATTTATVSGPGVATSTVAINPGAITSVSLPLSVRVSSSNAVTDQGILVKSPDEIALYGLNQRSATTDAFLGLPTDILGTEYRVASFNAIGGRPSQALIVGTQNGTSVTITTSANATGFTAGVPRTISLNRLQTFLIEASAGSNDLTGTLVTSDKPVSVFGGHQCGNVPTTAFACDHMVEQMTPTSTWGEEVLVVPLEPRNAGDIVRVIAHENATEVRRDGTLVATLSAGQFHEYTQPSTSGSRLTTTKPALVAQYSKGSSADGVTSDPFMMLIPPVAQYGNNYTLSTPAASPVTFSNWVNVAVQSGEQGGLRLDGAPIAAVFTAFPGATGYVWAQVPVSVGAHNFSHTSPIVSFGAFAYGWASFDSYGYPGGLRLAPLGDACTPTPTVPGDGFDNDCDNRIDEELGNGLDDDGDGKVDEDLATPPPNSPPSVAPTGTSITVDEGQTAVNTGTYSDPNAGDNITITASIGSVTKTGTNNGSWTWNYSTTDGTAQSGTVTITADDGNGGVTFAPFALPLCQDHVRRT